MRKLKSAECHYCGKRIKRHDPNRVTIQVGKEGDTNADRYDTLN